jgi:23S rRNA (pseudouridine1915-N3)-methyltransferase
MRLLLVSVGRLKAGPERDLAARYLERAGAAGRPLGFTAIDLREIEESRARRPEDRKAEEAKLLRAQMPALTKVIVFDERGAASSSKDFAALLGVLRDEGAPGIGLVIGGPDGLAPELRDDAARCVSFGAMTWPHQLVRIMAAEQIYRAMTILAGHPYHRE